MTASERTLVQQPGKTPVRVAVLVSTSRHPLSGIPCPNRNDVVALEVGRQLANGAPHVVHAGDPLDPALEDYLAYGAKLIRVLPAAVDSDIVPLIAEQLHDAQLILSGCRSGTGAASGMLPYLLAAALHTPVLTDVLDVRLGATAAEAVQFLPKGKRRRIEIPLPAVLAIHPLAPVVPRYAYARRVAGRIERPAAPQPAAQPDQDFAAWQCDSAERSPVKLKAPDRRSGHARMVSATGATHRGGQVVIDGSSVAKAQAVLDYLREHSLINF